MADKLYTYAVARIRSKELTLLTRSFFDQLLASKSYEDCMRLLKDKGWGTQGDETAEELLQIERNKTWDLIRELIEDMSVFDTFLYENDFHNLKAAIKEIYINKKFDNIYISHGTIDPNIIQQAVIERDFSLLPEYMRLCGEEAYDVQLHTGDSQLCDIIIDKAALETIYRKGKESKNELLAKYAQLKVAASNINIAIRSHKTGKTKEFLEKALVECDTLNKDSLIEAVLNGEEAIYDYLATTVYHDAVQAVKKSPSSFEKWCDNLIIEHIKPQKYNPFTLSPLAAYILARENEIKSVRIVLSGKQNELSEESVRERLREMYV